MKVLSIEKLNIDLLFSTGVVTCKNILDLTSEDIRRAYNVNVVSHYHVTSFNDYRQRDYLH